MTFVLDRVGSHLLRRFVSPVAVSRRSGVGAEDEVTSDVDVEGT